jgi:hypothetical protein
LQKGVIVDSYQPIYDAVRSKISGGSISDAVESAIRDSGIGHEAMMCGHALREVISDYGRPSAIYRPKVFMDGRAWCVLYGDNLQDGVAGFGDSPANAMWDFDKNWNAQLSSPQPVSTETPTNEQKRNLRP